MVINFVVLSRRSFETSEICWCRGRNCRKSENVVHNGTNVVGTFSGKRQNKDGGRKVIYCPLYRACAEFKVGFTHATPELYRHGVKCSNKNFLEKRKMFYFNERL